MSREMLRILWPETTNADGRGASVWHRADDGWYLLTDWSGLVQAERQLTASILETGHSRYIGYAEFAVGTYDVSAMVVPKTLYGLIPPKTTLWQADFAALDKALVAYLSRYFELLAASPTEDLHRKRISACHLQLAKNHGGFGNIGHPSDLLVWQSLTALSSVGRFFKQHPPRIGMPVRFVSDSLDGVLDIAACVVELDKSRLHQTKQAEAADAALAAITVGVLSEFLKRHESQGASSFGVAAKKARELQYRLITAYRVKPGPVGIAQLSGLKASAVFNSSSKRALLGWLQVLAGSHSMPDGNNQTRGAQPVRGLDAVFCSGQALFELATREVLRQLAPPGCHVMSNSKNTQDGADQGRAKTYLVESTNRLTGKESEFERDAKPDSVLKAESGDSVLVLDAKWKRFEAQATEDDSDQEGCIKFEDIAKLWRDATIYSASAPKDAVLLYPACPSELGMAEFFHKEYVYPGLWPDFKVHAIGIDLLNAENNKAFASWLAGMLAAPLAPVPLAAEPLAL